MSVLSRCGACLCAFAAFAAATQVIDVAMEEPTGSASDALAAFEFEKDAAAQKAKIAETVARATAKLDAALAGIGASKQHVSSAALEETLKTAAAKLDAMAAFDVEKDAAAQKGKINAVLQTVASATAKLDAALLSASSSASFLQSTGAEQAAAPLTVNVIMDPPAQKEHSANFLAASAEPQALLAEQSVQQAAEPLTINVHMDVPTKKEHSANFLAASAEPRALLAEQPVQQAAEPLTINLHLVESTSTKQEHSANFLQSTDAEVDASQMEAVREAAADLASRVQAGGQTAARALAKAIALAPQPFAKEALIAAGLLESATGLLKSESSSVPVRRKAASLVTLLTDLPVAASVSDAGSGADGRVFITVPRPSRVY